LKVKKTIEGMEIGKHNKSDETNFIDEDTCTNYMYKLQSPTSAIIAAKRTLIPIDRDILSETVLITYINAINEDNWKDSE